LIVIGCPFSSRIPLFQAVNIRLLCGVPGCRAG
jgi:hypothetical protein